LNEKLKFFPAKDCKVYEDVIKEVCCDECGSINFKDFRKLFLTSNDLINSINTNLWYLMNHCTYIIMCVIILILL